MDGRIITVECRRQEVAFIDYDTARLIGRVRRYEEVLEKDILIPVIRGCNIDVTSLEGFSGFPPNPEYVYTLYRDAQNNVHLLRMCMSDKQRRKAAASYRRMRRYNVE